MGTRIKKYHDLKGIHSLSKLTSIDIYDYLLRSQKNAVIDKYTPIQRCITRASMTIDEILDAIQTAMDIVPFSSISGVSNVTETEQHLVWKILYHSCLSKIFPLSKYSTKDIKEILEPLPKEDDIYGCWEAALQCSRLYYLERRAYYRVRIEFLRIHLFHTPETHELYDMTSHVVEQVIQENLITQLLEEIQTRQAQWDYVQHGIVALWELQQSYKENTNGTTVIHQIIADIQHQVLIEALEIRDLLLLALYHSKETISPKTCVQTVQLLIQDSSNWNLETGQDGIRIIALNTMLCMWLLHQQSRRSIEKNAILETNTDLFTLECNWNTENENIASHIAIVQLAWASYLQQNLKSLSGQEKWFLENRMKQALQEAETRQAFHCLAQLLDLLLVYNTPFITCAPSLVPPLSTTTKVSTFCEIAVYQHIGASFLNHVLGSLGYLQSLFDDENNIIPAHLHAMVNLVAPVLNHPDVAQQILYELHTTDEGEDITTNALSTLYRICKAQLPATTSSFLLFCTAMANGNRDPLCYALVTKQVLQDFATYHPTKSIDDDKPLFVRNLPPDQYITRSSSTEIVCCASFFYDDGLNIPQGTKGVLLTSTTEKRVYWCSLVLPSSSSPSYWNMYDLLTAQDPSTPTKSELYSWLIASLDPWLCEDDSTLLAIATSWEQARVRHFLSELPLQQSAVSQVFRLVENVPLMSILQATRADFQSWQIPSLPAHVSETVWHAIENNRPTLIRPNCSIEVEGVGSLLFVVINDLVQALDLHNSGDVATSLKCLSVLTAHSAVLTLLFQNEHQEHHLRHLLQKCTSHDHNSQVYFQIALMEIFSQIDRWFSSPTSKSNMELGNWNDRRTVWSKTAMEYVVSIIRSSSDTMLLEVAVRSYHILLQTCTRELQDDFKQYAITDIVLRTRLLQLVAGLSGNPKPEDLPGSSMMEEFGAITALELIVYLLSADENSPRPIGILVTQTASKKCLVACCGELISHPNSKLVELALKILHIGAHSLESLIETPNDNTPRTFVSIFEQHDICAEFQDDILNLLKDARFKISVWNFLSICTKYQPGFMAYIMDDVASILAENLRESERLLETETDVLCAMLYFLVQVWHDVSLPSPTKLLNVHIAHVLKDSAVFWQNLAIPLTIRMPQHDNTPELRVMSREGTMPTFIGRSGPYGYLARSRILQILAYEWHLIHNNGVVAGDEPLLKLLKKFREQRLFSHWLKVLTQLSSMVVDFEEGQQNLISILPEGSFHESKLLNVMSETTNNEYTTYEAGVLYNVELAIWQLGFLHPNFTSIRHRIVWNNVQLAHLHAHGSAIAQWKRFMELICLQNDVEVDKDNTKPKATSRKRKESMMDDPVESSPSITKSTVQSPTSHFAGDRTSYGSIHVISNVLSNVVARHNSNDSMSFFVEWHVCHIMNLFVAMIHHQSHQVLQKTMDPRFSITQERKEDPEHGTRLSKDDCLKLLRVVEASLTSFSPAGIVPPSCHELHFATLTATLTLLRHLRHAQGASAVADDLAMSLAQHSLRSMNRSSHSRGRTHKQNDSLFRLSWSVFYALFEANLVPIAHDDKLIAQEQLVTLLQNQEFGILTIIEDMIRGFRMHDNKTNQMWQESLYLVTKGLSSLLWNSTYSSVFLRVLLTVPIRGTTPPLELITLQLLPLLNKQMDREQCVVGVRGYCHYHDSRGSCAPQKLVQMSMAHEVWCALLEIVTGLVNCGTSRAIYLDTDWRWLWQFLAHAQPMLLRAWHDLSIKENIQYNMAVANEQLAILNLVNTISRSKSLRTIWRQTFPENHIQLLERIRRNVSTVSVLIMSSFVRPPGDSGSPTSASNLKGVKNVLRRRSSINDNEDGATSSPVKDSWRTARVHPSHVVTCSEYFCAILANEKKDLVGFYKEMTWKLLDIVSLLAQILAKWTKNVSDVKIHEAAKNKKSVVDHEQLVPLLTFSSTSNGIQHPPAMAHCAMLMDVLLDRSLTKPWCVKKSNVKSLERAVGALGLVWLKSYLIHIHLYEHTLSDINDWFAFVQFLSQHTESRSKLISVAMDRLVLDLMIAKVKPSH